MDKTKQTLVIALAAVLVVVAGGWFLLISPQRSQVASLNAETSTVNTSNGSLQTKLQQLRSESTQRTDQVAVLAAIAKRLPADLQEANLLDDLGHAADAANVDLSGITPAAPVLATAAVPTAAPATTSAGTSAVAGGLSAPRPVQPNQLYVVPVGLTVSGNYFDLEMFVHSLEGMQRAMLITELNFAKESSTSGGLSGAATTSAGTSAGTGTTGGSGGTTSKSTSTGGKTTTAGGKGSTTTLTKSAAKPVPGSAEAAQAELNKLTPVLPDSNTLTLQITGEVFSMYSPAVAAAAATPTPAPTTTK